MEDYLWRQGDRTIAKYVQADEIKVNTIARLTNNETCGYEEDGVYVGTYSSMLPNLKPKPGIVSKLLGKGTPQRNHLFVNIGPHKLIMKINSKWGSREEANILAIITATTPADHMHKLFRIARKVQESNNGIITASELISEVELDISAKFKSYVLSLNNPKDFDSKDDFVRIEHELRQIAEDEFSKIGVIVQSVAINYGDSQLDKLVDLQSEADNRMKTGIGERRNKSEKAVEDTATKQASLGQSIENMAIIEAHGDLAGRSAERLAREFAASEERKISERIKELEAEEDSNRKIRGVARNVEEQKAILQAALSIKSMLNSNEDGVESDEE
jgi:hypothetical protein